MTSKQRIAVVGTNALADGLRKLFAAAQGVEQLDFSEAKRQALPLDAVIETETLRIEEKRAALVEIERHVAADTLILSTVLGVTATQTASWLSNPSRLVGFATFVSQLDAELIEIAPALQTAPAYLDQARSLFAAAGKETETVEDEVGLVFPRILAMIVNEAAFALMEKTATAEDIDTAMRQGTNYPSGPLEWADEAGLDDILAVLSGLHRELGEDRYRPAPILRKLVYAGWTGKRAGRGFYQYSNVT